MREEKVGWLGGVVVNTKDARLVFDPVPGRSMERDASVFITHAHADHTYGFSTHATKYATAETRKIYEALRRKEVTNFRQAEPNQKIRIGDTQIVPLNAGHMLGSVQFKIITPERTILYTGDINCIDTLTTQAADTTECDTLIVEATYGHPVYVFPRRTQTYAQIVEWAMEEIREGRVPAFHVYSAGKAQEIIKLFNVYTKVPVVCHPSVSRVNEAHSQCGLELSYLDTLSDEAMRVLEHDPCVYVTTPAATAPVPSRGARALATGWAVKVRPRNCTSFPLSSHADFSQLLRFVKHTGAKTVHAFTGYTNLMTEHLRRKLEVEARPIPLLSQTRILDY